MDDPLRVRLTSDTAICATKSSGIAYYEAWGNDKNAKPRPRYILDLEVTWILRDEYRALLTFTMDKLDNGRWIITMKPTIRNDLSVVIDELPESQMIDVLEAQATLFLQTMARWGLAKRCVGGRVSWELCGFTGHKRLGLKDIYYRPTMARTSHPDLKGLKGMRTIRDGFTA